jgi:hypothetical protein
MPKVFRKITLLNNPSTRTYNEFEKTSVGWQAGGGYVGAARPSTSERMQRNVTYVRP